MPDVLRILPQQLVFGLALGTVYGLIALGYTMVYGILFMINFAHGEIFMIGAYVGWAVLTWLLAAQIAALHPAWALPLMLLPAMLATGLIGATLERFAYRPLYRRGATRLGPLISAIRLADRLGVAGDPGGRAGGARDGHQHHEVEAPGLRHRGDLRRDRREPARLLAALGPTRRLPSPGWGGRRRHPGRLLGP